MFGEKLQPASVDSALKKLISLRLSKMKPADIIGVTAYGSAAEPLAGFSKYGEAALANFLLYTRRITTGLSYIMPAKGAAANKFFNAADDKVKTELARGTSWATLSHWWSSVLKTMEKQLKTRGVGASNLNFDIEILSGKYEHNNVLQTESSIDAVDARVAVALGKRTNHQNNDVVLTKKQRKEQQAQQHQQQNQRPDGQQSDDDFKRFGNGSEKFPPMTRDIPSKEFPKAVFTEAFASMNKLFPAQNGKEPCVTWFITQGRCFNKSCKKHHNGKAGACMPADALRTGKAINRSGK